MDRKTLKEGLRVRRVFAPLMANIPTEGMVGTVQALPLDDKDILVGCRWDGFAHGHDNDLGIADQKDGWFVSLHHLEAV